MNIHKIYKRVMNVCNFVVAIVIIGFVLDAFIASLHVREVIPYSIESIRMKSNAMVLFLLSGIPLLLPWHLRKRIGVFCYSLAFIIANYIMLRYLLGDTDNNGVLFDSLSYVMEINSGRVSYLTLVCFAILSAAFILLFKFPHKFIILYASLLSVMSVCIISIAAIFWSSNFVISFYLWSGFTTMALQTSIGILLLGLVLILSLLFQMRRASLSKSLVISLLLFCIGVTFVAIQWDLMIDRSRHYVESLIVRNAQVIKLNIHSTFKLKDDALTRFFARVDHKSNNFQELWRDDAKDYFRDNRELLYLGIKVGHEYYLEQYRESNIKTAMLENAIRNLDTHKDIDKVISVNNDVYLLLTYPGENSDGVAVIDFNKFLNELIINDPEYKLLNLEIVADHQTIFQKKVLDLWRMDSSIINLTIPMTFAGSNFYIHLWPSLKYLQEVSSTLPLIFLFLWLLIFVMAAVMIVLIGKVNISNNILKQKVLRRTNLLFNSKKEYQTLYENSPELNLTISKYDYVILQCNETFVGKVGADTKSSVLNRTILGFIVDQASQERFIQSLEMLHQGVTVYNSELRLKRSDGGIIHVNAAFKINAYKPESLEHSILISMHDITREKELESELSKQLASQTMFMHDEQRYHTILNAVTDGWWDWHINTTELYYSDHVKELLGYFNHPSIEGYDNWHFWQMVVHQEDREEYLKLLKAHIEDGELFYAKLRLKHRLGHFIWFVLRGYAIVDSDGIKRRMVGTLTNITENQLLMQETIKVSNLQQAILNGTEDLIVFVDNNGIIQVFNHGAEKMLGYSANEMIGKQTPMIFHDMEEIVNKAEWLSTEFKINIEGMCVFTYEASIGLPSINQWTYICKDSSKKQVQLVVTALRNHNNEIYGFLGVGRDITALVEQNNLLKHSQELLIQTGEVGLTGGWNLDLATGKVEWTSGMYSIFEMPSEYELDLNQQLEKFGTNGSAEYLSKHMSESANTGVPYEIDFEILTFKGNHKWVHSKGIPIVENGRCVRMYGVLQDITDRVDMMNSLYRKEQILEQTGKIGLIGGWEHDFVTNQIIWTNIMYEILDTTPDYDCNNFLNDVERMFTSESVKQFNFTFQKMMDDQQPFEIELELITFKGNRKWLLIKGIPVIKNGSIIRLLGVWQDITDNVKLKNLLEAEKMKLLNVIECAILGTWEWDIQTGNVTLNEIWANIIGYTLEELEPFKVSKWFELIHPEDRARCQEMLQRHFAHGEDYHFETRLSHKNGTWVWVLSRGRVMSRDNSGNPLLMHGTLLDITSFKQLQIELQHAADRFKNLFDLAPVGIAMNDLSTGKYLDGNDSLLASMGYNIDELRALDYWDVTPSKYEYDEYKQIESMMATSYYGPYRKEYIRKDGSVYPVLLNGILTKDENGRDIIWSVIMDISNQVEYEGQLIQARQLAEDASSAKSQFVANMSHEIRTPMNAVIGLSQLLRDTQLNSVQSSYVNKIISSSKLLLGIINDILDYSKMESGKLELESNDFNLDTILSQLTTIFLANNRSVDNLELFFNIAKDVPYSLVGDQLRLTQVLTNLVSNAVKFTPHGKVILVIKQRAINESKVTLYFAVKDTGIGISRELQTKLFKPFSQSDSSITRKYGGTGLGLTISNQILTAMGSKINLKSQVGFGSVFSFEVELGYKPEPNIYLSTNHKKRVLVVDDEPITRRVIRAMLERDGFIVEEAPNAEIAINLVIQQTLLFEFILMDWNLPGMDGLQAIRNLRNIMASDSELKVPSILLISAYNKDEIKITPEEQIPFLTKPITRTDLLQAVSGVRDGALDLDVGTNLVVDKVDLHGKYILLVEDNLINQEVAQAMLERVGATVIIANNGLEAVNFVKTVSVHFDLILMDLQMPIMSGYEAANLINDMKLGIPIVALTATVMKDEIEKILASGMVAHIAKPIEKEKMFATLMKYLGSGHQLNSDSSVDSDDQIADVVIDWNHLNRIVDDKKLAIKLLSQLDGDLDGHMKELHSLIDDDNTSKVQRIIHLLKGVTGNLGIVKLYKTLVIIDGSVKNSVPLNKDQYQLIANHIREFRTVLANIAIDKTNHSIYSGGLVECLQQIKQQVSADQIVDEDLISYLMKTQHQLVEQGMILKLNDLLTNFEYTSAINLIDAILDKINH